MKPEAQQQVLASNDGVLSEYGIVTQIGAKVQDVKVGDKVGFSVFGIEKLILNEEKHYLIRETNDAGFHEFLLAELEY